MKIATGIIIIAMAMAMIITINFITGYRSAFEADQACHAILANKDSNKNKVGCDHDLETRQWILYEKSNEAQAAKVISRFKY